MEPDGIVDLQLWCVFESSWDRVLAKVQREGGRDIGEHEGDVVGEWFGEDGGQSRQHVINADGAARDGAIDE